VRKVLIVGIFSVLGIVMMLTLTQVGSLGYASDQRVLSPQASQTIVPAQNIVPGQPEPANKASRPAKGIHAITPPVTEAKVREYVGQQAMIAGVEARDVQVLAVQFTTGNEIGAALKDGDPFWATLGNEPVVFTTMGGEFIFWDMDNVQHTYHSSYKVFLARTGNLLREGTVAK
jgi:hypothetical protein